MSLEPDKIYHEVITAGNDWADKKAAYEMLDDTTKSVLAQIAGRYMDGKTTKTQAESNALASSEYRTHLETVAKARREFLLAQVKYDSLKMLAELRRTQESTRRAEMRL
jgi:hypothetical protein